MTTPRCPWCNTAGIKNVQAAPVGPVLVLYCGQCGAIFGVAPAAAAAKKQPKIQEQPVKVAPQTAPRPAPVVVKSPQQNDSSPEHIAAMSSLFGQGGSLYRVVRQLDDDIGENA